MAAVTQCYTTLGLKLGMAVMSKNILPKVTYLLAEPALNGAQFEVMLTGIEQMLAAIRQERQEEFRKKAEEQARKEAEEAERAKNAPPLPAKPQSGLPGLPPKPPKRGRRHVRRHEQSARRFHERGHVRRHGEQRARAARQACQACQARGVE